MMKPTPSAEDRPVVVGEAVEPEEQERVLRGDEREARHDDEVGHHRAPAAQPSGARAHGACDPREVRAAVRIGAVQVEERGRDARHGDERDPHDRRGLEADREGDEARATRRGCRRARSTRPRRPSPTRGRGPRPSGPCSRPPLPGAGGSSTTVAMQLPLDVRSRPPRNGPTFAGFVATRKGIHAAASELQRIPSGAACAATVRGATSLHGQRDRQRQLRRQLHRGQVGPRGFGADRSGPRSRDGRDDRRGALEPRRRRRRRGDGGCGRVPRVVGDHTAGARRGVVEVRRPHRGARRRARRRSSRATSGSRSPRSATRCGSRPTTFASSRARPAASKDAPPASTSPVTRP